MYGLNRLKSANHLVSLFTATAFDSATYSKWLSLLNPPLRSISFTHSSLGRVMETPLPAATAGIDDFVDVGEGGKISGEDEEVLPEKESGINERKVLPPELSRSVVRLTCESAADGGVCDVYLVGTCHVSTQSCREVEAVIKFLKPQAVFLELCSSRIAVVKLQNFKVPTMGEMVAMWKKNQNLFGILYSWFLAKVATELKVLPGAEFRVAYDEAMKYGGKVILGDRPVQITLGRTWAKMPLWHKTKLVYFLLYRGLFFQSPVDNVKTVDKTLTEMDEADMITLLIQETSKEFPTLVETIVHERDQYMSATLLKVAREHNSVVAVVGKGHLPGIQKNWKQPVEMKQLLNMPSEKNRITVANILTSIGATVAGVAIISGIYLSIKK